MFRSPLLICSLIVFTFAGNAFAQKEAAARRAAEAERAAKERALAELKRAIELKRLDAEKARAARLRGRRGPAATRPAVPVKSKPVTTRPSLPTAKVDEGKFALTLADETKLIGEPIGLAKVGVQTSFGIAQVPLNVIQKIDGVPKSTAVKIFFRNGDVVTGTLVAQMLRFKTTYGEVRFAANELVRMQLGTTFATAANTTSQPTRPVPVRVHRPSPFGGGMPAGGRFGRGGFGGGFKRLRP